jgi:hypothetical protein
MISSAFWPEHVTGKRWITQLSMNEHFAIFHFRGTWVSARNLLAVCDKLSSMRPPGDALGICEGNVKVYSNVSGATVNPLGHSTLNDRLRIPN